MLTPIKPSIMYFMILMEIMGFVSFIRTGRYTRVDGNGSGVVDSVLGTPSIFMMVSNFEIHKNFQNLTIYQYYAHSDWAQVKLIVTK